MAIPLAAVSEIARPPKVTRLPHVPAWVLGIANLRGDIVSMLDLEGFLSGKAGKSSHEQRMLALRPAGDEVRTAVLVDSVDGIQAFEDARIARVTRGYDAEVAPYARGLVPDGRRARRRARRRSSPAVETHAPVRGRRRSAVADHWLA